MNTSSTYFDNYNNDKRVAWNWKQKSNDESDDSIRAISLHLEKVFWKINLLSSGYFAIDFFFSPPVCVK